MKGGAGRSIVEIKDFTGGQVTRPPERGIDPKFSVDCLNVYPEGIVLRRRDGYTVENATATTGQGNGFYNWVKSASDQQQIVFFGSTLSNINLSSGSWTGTLSTISPDGTSGTAPTNAIMNFVSFKIALVPSKERQVLIR